MIRNKIKDSMNTTCVEYTVLWMYFFNFRCKNWLRIFPNIFYTSTTYKNQLQHGLRYRSLLTVIILSS